MQSTTLPTIDAQTLAIWLAAKHPLVMLDVRPTNQRLEWAIHGSLHLDAYDALWANHPEVLDSLALPRDIPVVTICAAGKTSLLAAAYLQRQGIKAVSLAGGMQAWSHAWNTADVPLAGSDAVIVQVRRLGKGCLSYIVGPAGDPLAGGAAVIDPSLAPEVYREIAQSRGWRITDVLDTHIHADHLSRARHLARHLRARLWLPAQERVAFAATTLAEGDELSVGTARIKVLATPGHTRESVCYLLDDRALITGDTVSLSGIGRPDLAQDAAGAHDQAALLYGSLQRLWQLPGDLLVLPAHAGELSAADERPVAATLGELQERFGEVRLSEAAFVERVLSRIPATPANYRAIIGFNESGEWDEAELQGLEVGANRCSVTA